MSGMHSRVQNFAGGNNGVGVGANLNLNLGMQHGAEQSGMYSNVINFASQRTLSRSSSLADLVAANAASAGMTGASGAGTSSVSNSPSSFGWNGSPTRSSTSGHGSGPGSGSSGKLRTRSSLSSMTSMTSSSQFVVGTPPPSTASFHPQFNAYRDTSSPPHLNTSNTNANAHGPLLPSFFADVLQSPFSSPRGLRGSSIEESDEDEHQHHSVDSPERVRGGAGGSGFSGDWMNPSDLLNLRSRSVLAEEDDLDDVVYPSSRTSSRRTSDDLSGELKELHDGAEKIVWNGRRGDVCAGMGMGNINRAVGEEWSDEGSGGSRSIGGSRRGSTEGLNLKNKNQDQGKDKELKDVIGAIGEFSLGRI